MTLVIKSAFWRQIATHLLFSILVSLLPFALSLAAVLYVIRWFLTVYKNKFKPEYGDLLSGFSTLHLVKGAYGKTQTSSIVSTHYVMDGHVSLRDFQNLVNTKIVQFQKEKPEPFFPELTQYLTTWLGFAVYKHEPDFRIEDHVKMLADVAPDLENVEINSISDDDMMAVLTKLAWIPFDRETSPWQFLIHHKIKNGGPGEGPKTIIFGKFHHALADGLSYITFLSCLANVQRPIDAFTEKLSKRKKNGGVKGHRSKVGDLPGRIFRAVKFPFWVLYDVSWSIINNWDDNVWHRGKEWPKYRSEFQAINLGGVPLEKLRRIRELYGQPRVFSVLVAALAGSLRKYLTKHKLEIPDALHLSDSIPIPKRTMRLTNNLTASLAPIPTGLNDRHEMLRVIDRESIESKKSGYPLAVLFLFKFMGMWPEKWREWCNFKICLSTVSTNMPTFDETISFCGKPVLKMHGFMSPTPMTAFMYFLITGYKDVVRVDLVLSTDNFKSMDGHREIKKYFMEELDALEDPKNRFVI